jgi:periplasmic divalent cation tolerance protein
MGAITVITTVGNEEQANLIAEELVSRRHACCVNILPGVRSIYRWQGKIGRDSELMLVIKTVEQEFEAVAATIKELHTYELPEILAFKIARGDASFLNWIEASLDKQAQFSDEEAGALLPDLDDSSF